MNYNGNYSKAQSGAGPVSGEGRIELTADALIINPKSGPPLTYSFRDIGDFTATDYKIDLTTFSGEKIAIGQLGYGYEDFLKNFARARNELILKDLLIYEKVQLAGIKGQYELLDGSRKGEGEFRVYDTALVVIPEKEELVRVSLSEIEGIENRDYKLKVTAVSGSIAFSMLGGNLDPLAKGISDAVNEIVSRIQLFIKNIAPQLDPAAVRDQARILREGRAVKKSELAPALWDAIEKRVRATDLKDEYDFLMSLAQKDHVRTGIKRGLMGDVTGDYLWFLIPLKKDYIAMEAVNLTEDQPSGEEGEEGGKATYFFKAGKGGLEPALDMIARGLIAINFRREPIYLPDDKLYAPEYSKYRFSVIKLPELAELRRLFAGRVIHSSPEQWQADVTELLGK